MVERTRLRIFAVLAAVVGIVILDFALGVAGWPSVVLSVLQFVAAVPWAGLVLARPSSNLGAASGNVALSAKAKAAARSLQALLTNSVFVLLLFAALLLKVVLLATSGQGYTPAQLENLYRTYVAMAVFLAILGWFGRGQRTLWFFTSIAEHPARMLAMSFAIASLLGGFLLSTPFALSNPADASFLDALFDATGAITGSLSVTDAGRHYQPFGQGVILVLMQLGGIGIMVLSVSIAVLAGRKMEVRRSAQIAELVDADSLSDLRAKVRQIIVWTLAIEAVGAIALYFLFDRPGIDAHPLDAHPLAGGGGAVWSAVFHSVSAFCNAGFALFRTNLGPFAADLGVNAVVSTLIVLGGLGFPVLQELAGHFVDLLARRPRKRLSLHARVVLLASALLIVAGAVPFLILEWSHALGRLPFFGKVLASGFQSITARTAGFSSVELDKLGAPALMVMSALMFVGAGPASTGGGIKVTTLAVLVATFRAEQSSAPAPTLLGREIPAATQRKALVVTFLSAVFVGLATFLILSVEDLPPLHVLFDVSSAFGSVGCSTGVPAKMGPIGKILLIVTMLIGRIGPLTFALAAASKPRAVTYRLPEERVMIG